MENIDSKIIRSEAANAGLAVGAVSGAYTFASYGLYGFLSGHPLVNWVVWGAKTFACIYLMVYFIRSFSARHDGTDISASRTFGTLTALFSALITAVCQYAALEWCFPDMFQTAIDGVLAQIGGMMDSNSMASIDAMLPKLPVYTMVTSLVWCFLFGWIVSLVASSGISGNGNPFDDKDDDDII